jgi:hypothetical protein
VRWICLGKSQNAAWCLHHHPSTRIRSNWPPNIRHFPVRGVPIWRLLISPELKLDTTCTDEFTQRSSRRFEVVRRSPHAAQRNTRPSVVLLRDAAISEVVELSQEEKKRKTVVYLRDVVERFRMPRKGPSRYPHEVFFALFFISHCMIAGLSLYKLGCFGVWILIL